MVDAFMQMRWEARHLKMQRVRMVLRISNRDRFMDQIMNMCAGVWLWELFVLDLAIELKRDGIAQHSYVFVGYTAGCDCRSMMPERMQKASRSMRP